MQALVTPGWRVIAYQEELDRKQQHKAIKSLLRMITLNLKYLEVTGRKKKI